MTTKDTQYGLILPKKQKPVAPKISNVFGDDNASDEEDGTDWVRKALKAEGEKHKMKKQTKLDMQKALKEDPTIYQYDEVYDDIERMKEQAAPIKAEKKKPKYIENLLKAAERRKKEQEYRIERMVQKEREAEGEMYADKESFVTSAYRAKLEEFKKMEEEEARMSRLEAIGDVTKQQDISGFYRHLYEQTVDNRGKTETETHTEDCTESELQNNDSETKPIESEKRTGVKAKKHRQYRQRVIEENDSDENEAKEEANAQSSNSPKHKSTDKSDEVSEPEKKKQKQTEDDSKSEVVEKDKIAEEKQSIDNSKENVDEKVTNEKVDQKDDSEKADEQDSNENPKKIVEKKDRSSIWQKRTVGPVFEAALERYYARKARRMAAM